MASIGMDLSGSGHCGAALMKYCFEESEENLARRAEVNAAYPVVSPASVSGTPQLSDDQTGSVN